nr:hypothetical protein [Saccharopolyspora pogona]
MVAERRAERAEGWDVPGDVDVVRAGFQCRSGHGVEDVIRGAGAVHDEVCAGAELLEALRRVKVRRNDADAYWSSGTAGAMPLILG